MKWSDYQVGDKDPGGEYQIVGIVLGDIALEWFPELTDEDAIEDLEVDVSKCRVFLIRELESNDVYGVLET